MIYLFDKHFDIQRMLFTNKQLSESQRQEKMKNSMSEFLNSIDSQKFRATNAHWNDLCLNDPWSVGYVSTLIETTSFNSKEEWEKYYYQSGVERNTIISESFSGDMNLLNDHTLKKTNPSEIKKLSEELRNLNEQFGRTRNQLIEKGKILYDYVVTKGVNISLEECVECVRFRTICETWNGIILRERNTIKTLNTMFKNIEFVKTTGNFDYTYAVDYELKSKGKLICAIQIKPRSYTYDKPYLNNARKTNMRKNKDYANEFGKEVFDVISKINGIIINRQVLGKIRSKIENL